MTLISKLQVKGFPGLADGDYELSQDTQIKWPLWAGKTSVLKAITWMLVGTDLQGKLIPNTENTSVTWRGAMTFQRKSVKGKETQSWDLNRIISGGKEHALAKMIPWYLFSWAMTNKKTIEIVTGINQDTYSEGGLTLKALEEEVKNSNAINKTLAAINAHMHSINNEFRMTFNKSIVSELYNPKQLVLLLKEFKALYAWLMNNKGIDDLTPYLEGLIKDSSNSLTPAIKYFVDRLKRPYPSWVSIEDRKARRNREAINSFANVISQLERCIRNIKNVITKEVPALKWKDLLESYTILVAESLEVWSVILSRDKLRESMLTTINRELTRYWMSYSLPGTITYTVSYKGKDVSIYELPRHVRFLYETNICSRIQSRGNENPWLILIDDYMLWESTKEIDDLLMEALAHQVIITSTNNKLKGLEFTL